MKLSEYLNKLARDKTCVIDDHILYLYDTRNYRYYIKIIYPKHIDFDGVTYVFTDRDVPFTDYDHINVVRAWTVTNAVNCMMGLDALRCNYGESEVEYDNN